MVPRGPDMSAIAHARAAPPRTTSSGSRHRVRHISVTPAPERPTSRTPAAPDGTGTVAPGVPAAQRATELGLQAYNILEGFEGDPDANAHRGLTGGWRMRGLPWRQN